MHKNTMHLPIHSILMYICRMHSKELLRGTLNTIILKLLAENGKMYGYEITQRVRELTDDKIILTEGALYPALHRLESSGLVLTETQSIGKRIRKYYLVTESGNEQATRMANEFVEFVQTMLFLLNPQLSKKNDPN